ncbi:probable N-acetyltransferase HLS1-like [Phoenix dactylifera]|uniref:Probable N-acetyltransferase HLS1-like n=1 Tax=Phoenix dactylifera TaxID=42345 RepID=A0A8B7CEW3_PHODC|nr:probable N-acetyltransferase HLS1-like [Phoenix dactylifera]
MDLNHGSMDKKVVVREFNREKDWEVIEKLERDCEIGSIKDFSILTNMLGDPLCRIRLYPLHVMLVAELVGNGEVVGVVRGCMKRVGTGLETGQVWMSYILGLRVSPKHRRMGIGLKLIKSVEDWAERNGARYVFLATEENNTASTNLFVLKCDYKKLSSLAILFQPVEACSKRNPSGDVRIEKLTVEQATSLYKDRLGGEKFFPADIDAILKEELSLGTWVSYFKEEHWDGLHCKQHDSKFLSKTPSSWAILSMWKTYEVYKLQIKGAHSVRCINTTLSHIRSKILRCLRAPSCCELLSGPFGFLFLYGLHGEGERMGDLMKSLWCFAFSLAKDVTDCKAIATEVSNCDPLCGHLSWGSSISRINDVWCLKKLGDGAGNDSINWTAASQLSRVFVDPRDF